MARLETEWLIANKDILKNNVESPLWYRKESLKILRCNDSILMSICQRAQKVAKRLLDKGQKFVKRNRQKNSKYQIFIVLIINKFNY